MDFIMKETGEKRSVYFMDRSGCDCSEDIAAGYGFDSSEFARDDETDALIAPKYVVQFWVEFFEIYNNCENELVRLKNKYAADEVDEILNSEMGVFDIDDYKEAVKAAGVILQKRFDTETAHLVGSYGSDLSQSDFQYFKESLYQRDDGSYFLSGAGGAATRYGKEDELGGRSYGERIFSITDAEARAWIASHCGKETA